MNNPAPSNYDVKRNADIVPVNKTRPCLFGHGFNHYRHTCDIDKGVKVYDYAAAKTTPDILYPSVEVTKRKFAAVGFTKDKQSRLNEN